MGFLILILGLAVWYAAHFFKRAAPAARARLGEDRGKGLVAIVLLVSVVLMVIGYRMAQGPVWWGRSPALVGSNNILMVAAFYLFAASGAKVAITRRIRHPQLTGFSIWAASHLLVNGDLESLVLFGGLLIWAIAEIIVINRAVPDWSPPDPVPARKEVTTIIAALVVFGLVALLHGWIGPWPFG